MPLNTLSQIYNTTAIKAIPNQNNNLLDFVGVSGTTVASVTPGGLIDLRAASGAPITLNVNDTSVIGDKIRLWGGEFGFGIQNSRIVSYLPATSAFAIRNTLTGADVIKLNGDGNVSARFFDTLNNNGAYFDMNTGANGIFVVNRTATHIPFTIKGAASQTANLQEWQDNAGSIQSAIGSDGTFQIKNIRNVGGSVNRTVFSDLTSSVIVNAANTNYVGLQVRRFNDSQTSDLQQWTNNNGVTVFAKVDPSGNFTVQNDTPRVRALRGTATAQTSGLGADNGIGWVGSETNTPFYLMTNNTERMRIDTSGNVNIGPATPAGGGTNTGGLSIRGQDIEIMNIMGVY